MSDFEDLNILDQLRIGIAAGLMDRDLDAIVEMVQNRRTLLKYERDNALLESLQPGDKVQAQNIRPKAFAGRVATVVSVNGEDVTVDFGSPITARTQTYKAVQTLRPNQLRKLS